MLADILLKGAIRFAIASGLNLGSNLFCQACFENISPELAYGYKKGSNKSNLIISSICNLLYFVPVLGTIMLGLNVLAAGANVATGIASKKSNGFSKYVKEKTKYKVEMPKERLKELELGKEMYKDLTDDLKLEGLNEEEIKSIMKEAKKENPYIREDSTKKINENKQRVENLNLLDSFKDYLKNPGKAYRFTVNKKIQFADVNDDTLTIGVTKPGKDAEKAKVLTKKFKLVD